MNKRMPRRTV